MSCADFLTNAGNMFASGLSVDYGASMLVAKPGYAAKQTDGNQQLATGIKLGMRFPSYKVLNQADARPWELQERLKSDGRFRIIVFAGNVVNSTQSTHLKGFCQQLASSSLLAPHLHKNISLLTVHSAKRTEVELLRDFPDVLHPFDSRTGWDYDSVYVDDVSYHEGYGDAYSGYGVDRETGCVVVTRPDQYVSCISPMDAEGLIGVEAFFKGILVS